MFKGPSRDYSRCFISAPFGMDLGALPMLLSERRIAWNWASDAPDGRRYSAGIEKCDFLVAVFNGTRSDHRVLYEAGLAEGLGKPVFFIAVNRRVGIVPRKMFPFVDVKLTELLPLTFQLDAFLATPHETVFQRELARAPSPAAAVSPPELPVNTQAVHTTLERQVYDAVRKAGGSAIVEPLTEQGKGGGPDLLIWLPKEDADLFDPAVVEIKRRVTPGDVRKAEEQLGRFMQNAGVRCGFLLTEEEPSPKRTALSPFVFWLSIAHFVALTNDQRLGQHIRYLRNHAAHGAP